MLKPSFKMLNPLNDAVNNLCCKRTKETAIIQNVVIAAVTENCLLQEMRDNNVSLMIDESTDVSCDQHRALVI